MSSPPASSFDASAYAPESTTQRMIRRVKEEPLIPLGMVLTCAALIGAARALRQNDHKKANMMFRRRVYAQGFTLVCICAGGLYFGKDREKRKEYEQLEKDKANVIKRDRWLAELEARDEEDKAARDRVVKLKEKRRQREEQVRARLKAEEGAASENETDTAANSQPVTEVVEEKADALVDKAKRLWNSSK